MRRLVLLAAAAITLLAPASDATAHKGSPNFESIVREAAPGLDVEVLNRDDRLVLVNRSGKALLVEGYDGEPYFRIDADGRVEVNERSPALYLNEDRYAEVDLPGGADADARPRWREIARNGQFEWHDHRIHWMARTTPPQVKDEDVRTKVFDWSVPMTLGGRAAALDGTLFWTPAPSGGPPLAAIAGLGLAALAGAGLVLRARRRRGRAPREEREAW